MKTRRNRLFLAAALTLLVIPATEAQPPLPRRELDKRLDASLYDVTSNAVKLFNAGNEEGCYRMFEGALRATIPLLDHRPELKKQSEDRLARARTLISLTDRAFMLREAVDDIRNTIRKDLIGSANLPPKQKTLWDRLGGEPGVRIMVKEMMKLAAADPKVNASRNGKFKPTQADQDRQEQRLVEFLSVQTGGPLKYSGKTMKAAHAGMGITDKEYDALVAVIVSVLSNHRVAATDIAEISHKLEGIRKDIVETKAKPSPTVHPLWDRLGGEEAVKKVVHDFTATAAKDPKVNFSRNGKHKLDGKTVAEFERKMVDLISSVTGGPRKYTGKDMKAAHAGMGITEAEFAAIANDLAETLKKHKVPQKESDELLAIVAATKKDIVEKK